MLTEILDTSATIVVSLHQEQTEIPVSLATKQIDRSSCLYKLSDREAS